MIKNKSRLVFAMLFLWVTAFAVASCSKGGEFEQYQASPELGVITYINEEDNTFEITADSNGDIYYVTEVNKPEYEIELHKRVYFGFLLSKRELYSGDIKSEVREEAKIYQVKLEEFLYILSKPIIKESFIVQDEEFRRDSIGFDGIRPYQYWLGGDYINIRIEYLRFESEVEHMVNLVWDDLSKIDIEEGIVSLYLRHNAYDEAPVGTITEMKKDTGICSFRLTDLIPEGKESIMIRLNWEWYNVDATLQKYSSDIMVFKPLWVKSDDLTEGSDKGYYFFPRENPAINIK